MEKIADYQNGNTHIRLYEDGTRIMETEDDEFRFEYPTNNDITITHKCSQNCPYCYLNCGKDGEHADILSAKFLDTLNPGSECAINLNDLDHPQLYAFLLKMRNQGVFVNGTVNQAQFTRRWKLLKRFIDEKLLWGLGVSLQDPTEEFVELIKLFPTAVIHVINGILKAEDLEALRDKGLKLLILGYKDIGRGEGWLEDNSVTVEMRQKYLKGVLETLPNHFAVISFDNLAIQQLDVRRILSDEQWEEFYQGDEGSSTFAIDLVDGTFGRNSMATGDEVYPILDDIREMFKVIKENVA